MTAKPNRPTRANAPGAPSTGPTQGDVLQTLGDLLCSLVLSSDNRRYETFGHAVNPHRDVVRSVARHMSSRDDETFATVWVGLWPRVVANAEAKAATKARAMVQAAPWWVQEKPR